ncbi:hypothetical protein Lepto7375DRAFT_8423 [Leptolyngbya sp. PCC 7375]|nr:hypothetical protein Lepto7375DRAFT_8423 [Leptolyngbya sp. PCC 7375]
MSQKCTADTFICSIWAVKALKTPCAHAGLLKGISARTKTRSSLKAVKPPTGTVSRHGEVEYLGHNDFDLHWYIEADDAVWHFVTAAAT